MEILTDILRGLEKWIWYADAHLEGKHRRRRAVRG